MNTVYITGHRNPDLDSVCSALVYASLKNRLDPDNQYIAVKCGHLSDSSKKIVRALGIPNPPYKPDLYPRVSDVLLTSEDKIEADAPLTEVAKRYKDSNPSVVPIYEKGEFYGLLSVDDISSWFMTNLSKYSEVDRVPTVREIMREQENPVQTDALFEEAKISLSQSKKRGLAVFEEENFVGYVTRRCFLKSPRFNVILVDHNEPGQSIKGIERCNLMEIIDHHRLDALKTDLPIFIDSEPLGSTCTIVYQLFIRNKLVPNEKEAMILLTGMMADTLILKSPTTTQIDIESAHSLAEICGVDVNSFGRKMFSYMESLGNQNPERAILADFKRYTERGTKIGIGQCEVTTLNDLETYKEAFAKALEDVRTKNSLDWAVVMVTDVMEQDSILFTTDYRTVKYLPYAQIEPGILNMPGVMSRKKQLLPEMLYTLGT